MVLKIKHCFGLKGLSEVPGDKSITHRALLFSLLSPGTFVVRNPLLCEDTKKSLEIIKELGVSVQHELLENNIEQLTLVSPEILKDPKKMLDCGRSGTTMRLLMGILASTHFEISLTGDAQLLKRPMKRIYEPLNKYGANITPIYSENKNEILGYTIRTPEKKLNAFHISPKIASAQLKSALLLAGLNSEALCVLNEKRQTRDHTERLLIAMGASLSKNEQNHITLKPVSKPLSNYHIDIPADPSSTAFIATAAALVPNSSVLIRNVSANPTRTAFFRFLEEIGVQIRFSPKKRGIEATFDIHIQSGAALSSFDLNEESLPLMIDELPLVALMATQCAGQSTVKGAQELKVKESDRLNETARILQDFSADISVKKNGWIINGGQKLKAASLHAGEDHRLVMMASIAGLLVDSQSQLTEVSAVKDSFPTFYQSLSKLGAEYLGDQELEIQW